jgi:hydrogenase expression/formation protein HypE
MTANNQFLSEISCPIDVSRSKHIEMEHGAGGRKFQQLLQGLIKPIFGSSLQSHTDSAVCQVGKARIAFTTDTYVVDPIFFPGGDIGSLAVHGTINDLAMVGARPLFLSCGLIVSEGVALENIQRVLTSMRRAADDAGVTIVTGDTKVIERRIGEDIFINTSGVGELAEGVNIAPSEIHPGDSVIVNGGIGNHGATIMAIRDGLEFESDLLSDSAPLHRAVDRLITSGIQVHCLRDITRGGLSAALVEISESAKISIAISESSVPVETNVKTLCRILGLEPFHLACEGRFLLFCPAADEDAAIQILREFPEFRGAQAIGRVSDRGTTQVICQTPLGSKRRLELPLGLNLPRIC